MQLNLEMTEKDLEQYRALSSVIAQGRFDLHGNAVVRVAQLVQWYSGFGAKIQEAIKLQAASKAPKRKTIAEEPK